MTLLASLDSRLKGVTHTYAKFTEACRVSDTISFVNLFVVEIMERPIIEERRSFNIKTSRGMSVVEEKGEQICFIVTYASRSKYNVC